jgi:hypothetical protein
MARINVTDDADVVVGWFNPDKAEIIKSGRTWDGSNQVSIATGRVGAEEYLYRRSKFGCQRMSEDRADAEGLPPP